MHSHRRGEVYPVAWSLRVGVTGSGSRPREAQPASEWPAAATSILFSEVGFIVFKCVVSDSGAQYVRVRCTRLVRNEHVRSPSLTRSATNCFLARLLQSGNQVTRRSTVFRYTAGVIP